ncbi:co-chaperone DjlA [Alteromonas oceanisediminis]|uniref:co-chaperone DjlA n=1 Tax=Alteromonas oceanisediminis TaxID=2836180 RepID=UPI001BD99C5B|nr:co-chaperone DjlA [Alteromonas oceanisediminis]MBT0585224.1 co-chaperone DjlA [Alteromonas oceanisediminis]
MAYWGKIIGVIIGAAAFKLPGAIIGLIVGHFFDKGYSQDFSQMGGFGRFFTDTQSFKKQAIFFHTLFASLGHLAKADGAVTTSEIAVATRLMDEMQLTGEDRQTAQDAFREGKAADYPIHDSIREFVESCHGRRDILQIFLEILIQSAFSDGNLTAPEMNVLAKVADSLGFKRRDLDYLISMYEAEIRFRQQHDQQRSHYSNARHQSHRQYRQQSGTGAYTDTARLADAHKILGVSPDADDAAVKKTYRKLMATHHPDKLMSKGLPEQAMKIAKAKAQDIQAAYELIKDKRGFK